MVDNSLQSIVSNNGLRFIFVGGKGGVGKTTTASAVALLLAKSRPNVLIISTDPAHNLGDWFDQQLSTVPTQINGTENLFAMEINPEADKSHFREAFEADETTREIMADVFTAIPGIDEAMTYAEMMNNVMNFQFTTIVFDTAPTGHTLRLLNFPDILDKGLNRLISMKQVFDALVSSFNQSPEEVYGSIYDRITEMKNAVTTILEHFKNPEQTTFIAVCIPEYLSIFETERLVQELFRQRIDIGHIVVNQVVFADNDCGMCNARSKMQQKYMEQLNDLYDDFHIVTVPYIDKEIKGVAELEELGFILV